VSRRPSLRPTKSGFISLFIRSISLVSRVSPSQFSRCACGSLVIPCCCFPIIFPLVLLRLIIPLPNIPRPTFYPLARSLSPSFSCAHSYIVLSSIFLLPLSGEGCFILRCWRSAFICHSFCTTFDENLDDGNGPPYSICSPCFT